MSLPRIYLSCSCGGEIISIDRFEDDPQIYLAVWKQHPTLTWKSRLRWIWNLLVTGEPYADDVVLDIEDAKKLVEILNDHIHQH
jgi:hypothetical protein